jgi:hypothetical protein
VTLVPSANRPVQLTVDPAQVMPPGFDVTVPELVPPRMTVSGSVRTLAGKENTESSPLHNSERPTVQPGAAYVRSLLAVALGVEGDRLRAWAERP